MQLVSWQSHSYFFFIFIRGLRVIICILIFCCAQKKFNHRVFLVMFNQIDLLCISIETELSSNSALCHVSFLFVWIHIFYLIELTLLGIIKWCKNYSYMYLIEIFLISHTCSIKTNYPSTSISLLHTCTCVVF